MALAEDEEIGRSVKESSLRETRKQEKAGYIHFAEVSRGQHSFCATRQYLRRPASPWPSSVMSSASLWAILMANSRSRRSCSNMAARWACSSRSAAIWISSSACKPDTRWFYKIYINQVKRLGRSQQCDYSVIRPIYSICWAAIKAYFVSKPE